MNEPSTTAFRPRKGISSAAAWLILWLIFAAVQFASLFTPPLLDDVDATHAQAAQHMAETGDLVTLYVNGIRYLEKPPLPYWLTAADFKIFGQNVFAAHLPNALAILGCAWICWLWAGRAWGRRAGYYAALAMLTAIGPFLFTRFAIPEALITFLLMLALWNLLTGLEDRRPVRIYAMWAAVALALLAKGLEAPVFFIAAAVPFFWVSGLWRRWRELKPVTGFLLFLAVAAPWHILAGLANPDQGNAVGNHPTLGNVHGFWYFYFINEHVLRFLGGRYPNDYNKMPFAVYWLAHLVWLFPWSIFVPAALVAAWRSRRSWIPRFGKGGYRAIAFDPSERENSAALIKQSLFRDALGLAAGNLLGIRVAVLFHFHQPGVLHVSRVAGAADLPRGGCGRHRKTARAGKAAASHGLAHGRAGGAGGVWNYGGMRAGLGIVGLAQPALRSRYRHPAGASRRGRIHALHVAFL